MTDDTKFINGVAHVRVPKRKKDGTLMSKHGKPLYHYVPKDSPEDRSSRKFAARPESFGELHD